MGTDERYADQRTRVAAELPADLNQEQSMTIAFAVVPWLDDTPATFAFFEEMRHLREAADLPSNMGPAKLWDTAYDLVHSYRQIALEHGAAGYVRAAEAALSGSDPAETETRAGSITLGDALPERVPLLVGGTRVDLETLESKKGNLWYSIVDDSGHAARGGVALDPTGSLPAAVELAGAELVLGPAPVYDRATRSYRDNEFEPFDLKRVAEHRIEMGGHQFEARVVLSVRKDGRWNLTARLVPQETVPADLVGRSLASGQRASATGAVDDGPRELSAGERELIEALKDR